MLKLNAEKLEKVLIERISNDINENTLIGASCAVIQGDERVCTVIKGVSNPETNEPLQVNNIFRIASMTKLITIAGLLKLIERGNVTYDTRVSDFFPGFKKSKLAHIDVDYTKLKSLDEIKGKQIIIDGNVKTPMTIHHLVTHTNGLGSGLAGMIQAESLMMENKTSLKSIVDFYQNEGIMDFEPGSVWAYSGLAAFDVIGRIIEILSDMEFSDYINKHILTPLEMTDTAFQLTDEQWTRVVAIHDNKDGKAVSLDWGKSTINNYPATNPVPGGGLFSTLNDFCNFVKMLLDRGIYGGQRILNEESVAAMGTQRISDTLPGVKPGTSWGVGCLIYKNFSPMPVGSFGWSGALGTHMWVDPANKIGAVYMRNSIFAGGAEAITARNFESDVYSAVM
jgi:CubicO group peptidase (beta-lactamase class C family)